MQNAPAKTVVCLKWGDLYSAEYVNKLYRGVCRHLSPPFSFVAFVDDATGLDEGIEARDINALTFAPQLCNIWWKLAIMHPAANLRGSCLFLDLGQCDCRQFGRLFYRARALLHYPQLDRTAQKPSFAPAPPLAILRFIALPPAASRKRRKIFYGGKPPALPTEKTIAQSKFF